MIKHYLKILITAAFCVIFPLLTKPVGAHEALPSGFTNTTVVSGFNYPTAITQTPDGRFFVLEKGGKIKIVQNNTVLASPLLSLNVDEQGERGLLGIALDTNFSSNGYMYIYYVNKSPLEIHISRFTVSGNSAGNEVILLKSQPIDPNDSQAIFHYSGTLRIGPDGKLWATVGNKGKNANSQDLSNIHGKILRMNLDGSVPTDNPFYNQAGKEGHIWAYGFRNPFRFNFFGVKPIVGDVGQDSYEEINLVQKGGNYGWPQAEGFCQNCGSINPLFAYAHNGASSAITGGFYLPTGGNNFPAAQTNAYYYGDYAKGFIHYLSFDSQGNFVADNELTDDAGSVVDFLKGNDGALYYVTIANETFGENTGSLHQIAYGTQNLPPDVHIDATPKGGLTPLVVQFSSAGTIDPANKPLTYSWEFGDGSTNSSQPNPTHTYTQNGTYTATLTVSNGNKQALASVQIQVGNRPPTATITTPTEGSKYNAGQTISYAATATDPEDGTLSAAAYSWQIIFHHDTHVHPFAGPLLGTSGTFVIPDSGEPSANTWFEISLTVTDSKGLQTTLSRMIYPNVISLTITSAPVSGLIVKVDGVPLQTPYTVQAVVGFKRIVDVVTPQNLTSKGYDYLSWSDGGAKQHTITTPSQNTTYTASFTEFAAGTGHIRYRVREMNLSGQFTGKFLNGVTAKLTDITGEDVYLSAVSGKDPYTGQDGWVFFDNVDAGTYGLVTYDPAYKGAWKQTDCNGTGTKTNATIQNKNTENKVAVFQSSVKVQPSQIAYCKDAGLQETESIGNIVLKVWNIVPDSTQQEGYGPNVGLNDVTVKLMSNDGNTLIKTTKSVSQGGDPGWVIFSDIPTGTYGLLAYKSGMTGFWRQTSCNLDREINIGVTNSYTEGTVAAWNPNIPVTKGETTYCRDLGLQQGNSNGTGRIAFRVRTYENGSPYTNHFVNGATVKLTDTAGTSVLATTTSQTVNGQDGWAIFPNIGTNTYGVMTYKQGYEGAWKQTTCEGQGTTSGATIQNQISENMLAAWQNNVAVTNGQTTWCQDVALEQKAYGSLYFKVREYENGTPYSGKVINGVTAKLLDTNMTAVYKTATSSAETGNDGWVQFDNVPAGTYALVVYKDGYEGMWRQTTCEGQGTTTNTTVNNAHTDGKTAGLQPSVTITGNQTTWCQDVALKQANPVTYGSIAFRVREIDSNGHNTGNFVNGATVKLVNSAGAIYPVETSKTIGDQEGWVIFSQVATGISHSIYTYKQGMEGAWKQTTCEGSGSIDAAITNQYTDGMSAARQENVTVTANQVTWCKDVGLKPMSGNLPTNNTQPTMQSGVTVGNPPSTTSTPTPTTLVTPTVSPTIPSPNAPASVVSVQ